MGVKLFISLIYFYNFFLHPFGLHPTLHPTKDLHPLFHSQCLEFYLKQIVLFLEFIFFFLNILIVERFDSLSLLQNPL
jgi:hypothetical protein